MRIHAISRLLGIALVATAACGAATEAGADLGTVNGWALLGDTTNGTSRYRVYTEAIAADGSVLGGSCQWALSSPAMRVTEIGPSAHGPGRESELAIDGKGTFFATCRIGGKSLTLPITIGGGTR